MAEDPVKKSPKTKKTNPKIWIGLLVALVILVGGMSFMQMKKNKALQEKLDAKKTTSSSGMEGKETDNLDPVKEDKETAGGDTQMGDPK